MYRTQCQHDPRSLSLVRWISILQQLSVYSFLCPLRYEGDRTEHVEAPNGPSAERNLETTQRELDKEIANGDIIWPWTKPPLKDFRVTPRGIKLEATKDRPITMGNLPLADRSTMESPRQATWRWPASVTLRNAFSGATHARVNAHLSLSNQNGQFKRS